jgi:hypothetical protein
MHGHGCDEEDVIHLQHPAQSNDLLYGAVADVADVADVDDGANVEVADVAAKGRNKKQNEFLARGHRAGRTVGEFDGWFQTRAPSQTTATMGHIDARS